MTALLTTSSATLHKKMTNVNEMELRSNGGEMTMEGRQQQQH